MAWLIIEPIFLNNRTFIPTFIPGLFEDGFKFPLFMFGYLSCPSLEGIVVLADISQFFHELRLVDGRAFGKKDEEVFGGYISWF